MKSFKRCVVHAARDSLFSVTCLSRTAVTGLGTLALAEQMFGVVVARGFAAFLVYEVLELLVGVGVVLARSEAGF